jgi:hypothetical protein
MWIAWTGDDFPSAMELLDAIFNMEEQMNAERKMQAKGVTNAVVDRSPPRSPSRDATLEEEIPSTEAGNADDDSKAKSMLPKLYCVFIGVFCNYQQKPLRIVSAIDEKSLPQMPVAKDQRIMLALVSELHHFMY